MDLASFKTQFPEFAKAPDVLIEAKLAAASLRIDVERYGDTAEEAHGLLTAHLLAISPLGTNVRLEGKAAVTANALTTYEAEWRKLERAAATMIRVF